MLPSAIPMRLNLLGTLAAAVAALAAGAGWAAPGLVYDAGGKLDQSFNTAIYSGASRWAEETGQRFAEAQVTTDADRDAAIQRLAADGANPVLVAGFAYVEALERVARRFPQTTFVLIDAVVDQPNVRSVLFKEHEGSYLVGMLAAMASRSGVVGFVGGMDIPLIRRFACGYAQGVKAADADATVLQAMIGTTSAAWRNPERGAKLAKAQIGQGADVIFAAAGGSGSGVLDAAATAGILSIGVDRNQNGLHPGQVLTSMLKRVDLVTYEAFMAGPDLETGTVVLGLATNGVGYALDDNNAALVTSAMQTTVDRARAAVIRGDTRVHDYVADRKCPVHVVPSATGEG